MATPSKQPNSKFEVYCGAKIITTSIIDDFLAPKEDILSTHNWGEKYYIYSRINGEKGMGHSVEKCQDCGEYKNYNRSDIQPCPVWLNAYFAAEAENRAVAYSTAIQLP